MMEAWKKKYYKQRIKILQEETKKHLDIADLMISELQEKVRALNDS